MGTGTDIDFEEDLGLDSSGTVGRLDGYYRFSRRHRFDFSVFDLSRAASVTIDEQIQFGDQMFDISPVVFAEFDLVHALEHAEIVETGGFMHYAISTTWGPTDTTRASLPFIFAASALQSGDSVMIMLFHDSVLVAVEGTHGEMMPVGPPARFEEVFAHAKAEIIVCAPCAEARGITEDMLIANCRFGGMNDFHAHVALEDCKTVAF